MKADTHSFPPEIDVADGALAEAVVHPKPDVVRPITADDVLSASPGDRIAGAAFVIRCEAANDRYGRTYLMLTLRGSDGAQIEARWWRYPYPADRRPRVGHVCAFTATVELYGDARQLSVTQGSPLPNAPITQFVRTTKRPLAELREDLEQWITPMSADLAALVRAVLSGEVYDRYCTWPAAQIHHGAVRHGLLAHSLRVTTIAHALASAYTPDVIPCDHDVLTAACLLHDVGKVRTLPSIAGAELPDLARQFDHITLSVMMVHAATQNATPPVSPERLALLTHAILAHHGRNEWGSTVEPQTSEAWLLHLADLAESRLWAYADQEQPV